MQKIYKLTAFNLKQKYFTEERYFTSYNKAKKQMLLLIDYINHNHDLNIYKKEVFKIDKDGFASSIILDGSYNVTIIEHEIMKENSIYLDL